jgi:hypothetical protein
LRNHREAIAAIDFFAVATVMFGVLQVSFVIGHDRRRILHFNLTRHPTSTSIVQQLREAFPCEPAAKFLILDHDSRYGSEVPAAIRAMDIKAVRTTVSCPSAEPCCRTLGGELPLVPAGLIDSSIHNAMCCCPPRSPAIVRIGFLISDPRESGRQVD